jgi:membrane-associated phospholipid phosphatase
LLSESSVIVASPAETRPWGRALLWIAILGPLFFATYGYANHLASVRPEVQSIVFAWERWIPFVPWTILPYWSIDLLYGLSLLVCATRREVFVQAMRLLSAQVISVSCFIALPLTFTFTRPATEGVFGAMFDALMGFDKPFNQAPSLHIVLLVVIWVRLAVHASRRLRWPLHAWMALIGVSVLTTYQHHFIDVPTGVAAGLLCLWLWPDEGRSPLTRTTITTDPRRRSLALRYALGAIIAAAIASLGGWALWLLWVTIALTLVGLGYAFIGVDVFQKNAHGRLSLGARGLLAPYLVGAWINSRLWTLREPAPVAIADDVWLGRFPAAGTLTDGGFRSVVDLSAEFDAPWHAGLASYVSVPILDLTAPDPEVLRRAADAIEAARGHGPVLVCCALGYSRSAAAIVAWLLATQRASSLDTALDRVRVARPRIVLEPAHRSAIANAQGSA